MKTRFKLAIVSLIFFITISPVSLSALVEYVKASNYEIITEDQEWTTDKIIDRDVFVDSNVTLIIKKGVTVTFKNKNIHVYGTMVVGGTLKNPVIFKKAEGSQNYAISIWQGGELIMRNADVSGGGGFYPWVMQNNSILSKSYAAYGSYQGAVHAGGGILNVQGSSFHDNDIAVYADSTSARKVIVNRSKFFNNSRLDVAYAGYGQTYGVDGRYNWWGNAGEPLGVCAEYSDDDSGCKIKGAVDFSHWLTSENFHDPVVIVPGIFGSQEEATTWKIDPIFHVYDNLYDEFAENGYTPGKDLFVFPYDWHDSGTVNAARLKQRIGEIKSIAKWPKVDIVAHSMGGLIARQCIESNIYTVNDIDQLITLGTPNNGSPEAYPFWEAGKPIGVIQSGMKRFLMQEVEEDGYVDMFSYIRNRPVSSVQELLPNYEYLYDIEKKQPLIYPSDYPVNSFLDRINSGINLKKLLNVEYTKIAGNVGSDKSTISGFNVIKTEMNGIWEHGYPISFEIPIIADRGVINGYGDGTVPIFSAKSDNIRSDNYIELDSSHKDLPTKAQKDILETLTGTRPNSEVTDNTIVNILQALVFSPIDIQIISPSGIRYGKDFENSKSFESVSGSFYTGFDTENEFITIPNPEEGEYRIVTQGTGDGGQYRVEIVKISENPEELQNAIESAVTIAGTAVTDQIDEVKIEVNGNQVIEKNQDVIAPETTIEFSGTKGTDNWYTSDVAVNLTATDNEGGSGVESISYSLDNGTAWNNYSQPLNVSLEGSSVIKYYSTDKLGNKEEEKVATIKIDKTAPVTSNSLSGALGTNDWYVSDVSLVLSSQDNESGSGVARTEYSLGEGNNWIEYVNSVTLSQEGVFDISYRAVDKQDNIEEIKKVTIKIDKTAPEAKFVFNPSMQKLDIAGWDNLSQNVSVTTTEQASFVDNYQDSKKKNSWFWGWFQKPREKKITETIILTDQSGHKTEIIWEKKKDKDRRINLAISSISYDGVKKDVSGILQYKWLQDWRKNKYTLFASHLSSQASSIESHYLHKQNQTWIMERPKEIADDDSDDDAERRPVWKRLPGMVIPGIITEKGIVQIIY